MTKRFSMLCGIGLVFAFQTTAPAQTITNQPQSITINNASTATFTVGASGATSYQWQFDGSPLSDGTKPSDGVIISGSTNSVLTLENVSSNEAGTYTVLINGSATSLNAVLTIVPGTIVTLTFSGILGGGRTNMTVQLFDHDKPATVQNFLHYIRSGAYSNMFMERCIPGFILQGGDYGTSNRTDTTSPVYGWDVYNAFTLATNQNPPFPPQIAGEFYNGPQIKNDFGTLAMALESAFFGGGLPNTGRNGFFFNLADNSGSPYYFDTTLNGPFTVFGRVISGTNIALNGGTNVLNYFNSLTTNGTGGEGGIFTNGGFLDQGTNIAQAPGFPVFVNLPLNNTGTNAANANLVYCDFSVATNAPLDTNPPTVAITNLAPDAFLTNQPVIQGTASADDGAGLALVTGVLTPQETNGIYANGGAPMTSYAVGTTNWSLTFSDTNSNTGLVLPGTYVLSVQSQDGAGYLSTAATNLLTITAVTTNGLGTVSFTNAALANFSPIGYPFQEDGTTYEVQAVAQTNQIFVGWSATNGSGASGTSFYPVLSFVMSDGLLLTATFISNGFPGSVAFAPDTTNAVFSGVPFNISGTISGGPLTPVTVTCTIFSQTSGFSVASTSTSSSTTNWSVGVTNLILPGSYIIQAIATDEAGESTMITNTLTITDIKINGGGSVTLMQGTNLIPNAVGYPLQYGTQYEVKATPAPGQTLVSWTYGDFITTEPVLLLNYYGGLLTATFAPTNAPKGTKNIISFTYPPANAKLTPGSFPLKLKGKIAASLKSAPVTVTCQIYSLNTDFIVGSALTTVGTNTWAMTVTNLPPDNYVVQAVATNSEGYGSVISEKFSVLDFKGVAGTYNGLFICTNGPVTATNSGFFKITVTASGAFSGKFLFPAYAPTPLNAGFYGDGTVGVSLNYPKNLVYASMALDLTNGTDALTGRIYSASNTWSSQLVCYRAVTKLATNTTPAKGKYVLSINPTGWPNTNGYASLSVGGSGALTLGGELPDGASFSQSVGVSKSGVWPLYVIPAGYRTNGMLMGWETNQPSGACSGQLYWYKKGGIGTYYTNGVNSVVNSTGTNYLAPVTGNYSIVFQGGIIGVPLTNDLKVAHAGGQFAVSKPAPADKLTISLSPNGVLTGHFVNINESKPLQFKGAYFGKSNGGSGFILEGDGETGYFSLEPQ